MKRGNLVITLFLAFVLVFSSVDAASDNSFIGFFENLFNYLFTPLGPQFAVDRDDGGLGGGGGSGDICNYNCQNSCLSGEIEMSGACISPLMCCRTLNVCGDHIIDSGEDCELLNLNGETCISQGYDSGTLTCTDCSFDYSGCAMAGPVCSDGTCDAGEDCTNCPQDCGNCKSLSDLVLYLPFDGNYLDYSGNGYHGNCTNCPTLVTGYNGSGSAYEFNGVDTSIIVPDNDDLDLIGDYSIAYWVKINNYPSAWNIISKEHYTSDISNAGYVFDGYNNDFYFYPNSNSDAGTNAVTTTISSNDWMYLAVTYNSTSSELNLYINATLVNSNPASVSAAPHTNDLHIGSSTTPDRYFNGAIDELRIYNRALSESEIQNIVFGVSSPECVIDDDCNYLDNDYCNGTELLHDEGICNVDTCEVSNSLVEDCFIRSYFSGVYNQCTLGTGSIDQYGSEWSCSAGSCVDLGTPIILGSAQICIDNCGVVGSLVADQDLCYDINQTACPQINYPLGTCIGDVHVTYSCSGANAANVTTDCDSLDGWYLVSGPIRWVADGECTEKEQVQENLYDYFCYDGGVGCTYGAGAVDSRWIDTGNVTNVVDGTNCSIGLCESGVCVSVCTDNDNDNYYVESSGCDSEPGFLGHDDCDDNDNETFYLQDFYLDEDHDIFGTGDVIDTRCWGVGGYWQYPLDEMAFNNLDCDDLDDTVYPNATEVCNDLKDNDCDLNSDCDDSDCDSDPSCVNCGLYSPGLQCVGLGCDNCYECNGALSNGLGDACVNSGMCNYSCIAGDCGAMCNEGEVIENRVCLDEHTVSVSTSSCDSSSCIFNEVSVEISCLGNDVCIAGACIPMNLSAFIWEIRPGFNFVALPLNEILDGTYGNSTNISMDYSYGDDAFFTYDAVNQEWLVDYGPLSEVGDYEPLRGYILYTGLNADFVYAGIYNSTYIAPLINDSWNLVGVPRNETINGIYGAGIYTVYEWDGFDYIDVSGANLNVAKAYWVYPGVPSLAPPSFSFWNWLLGIFS